MHRIGRIEVVLKSPISQCPSELFNHPDIYHKFVHHIIPKLILKRMKNSDKEFVDVSKYLIEVYRPCHNELAKDYRTVDMILDAPAIQLYFNWKRR
ncbi:unnamed protein product [Rotaria sordida]|uniref:Uncharacterized protein n=1 Tax=Rotaria sordida TaxID=392033 RepID=A0A816EHW5_9BILA|nr:unnamed protein product [Rotaria sordida]CAF1649910.1 unnamed protein product [Rotaria sordida]